MNLSALFAKARLMLQQDDEAGWFNACAKAIDAYSDQELLASHDALADEITHAVKLKILNTELSRKVKLYLNLALFLASGVNEKERWYTNLSNYRKNTRPLKTPVIILAGGASGMEPEQIKEYSWYILELMRGFRGTIISGGTTAGIPGLTGQIKVELEKTGPVDFDLIAYLPEILPEDAEKSMGYDRYYETTSNCFSSLDILTYWTDLICQGIHPGEVMLIGIDGGKIAAMEYRIALSFGAKVALVGNSGRAVAELISDEEWKCHPNLLILPDDPLAFRAWINHD